MMMERNSLNNVALWSIVRTSQCVRFVGTHSLTEPYCTMFPRLYCLLDHPHGQQPQTHELSQ